MRSLSYGRGSIKNASVWLAGTRVNYNGWSMFKEQTEKNDAREEIAIVTRSLLSERSPEKKKILIIANCHLTAV